MSTIWSISFKIVGIMSPFFQWDPEMGNPRRNRPNPLLQRNAAQLPQPERPLPFHSLPSTLLCFQKPHGPKFHVLNARHIAQNDPSGALIFQQRHHHRYRRGLVVEGYGSPELSAGFINTESPLESQEKSVAASADSRTARRISCSEDPLLIAARKTFSITPSFTREFC